MHEQLNERLSWILSLANQLYQEVESLAGAVQDPGEDLAALMGAAGNVKGRAEALFDKLTLKPAPDPEQEKIPVPEVVPGAVVGGGDPAEVGSKPLELPPGRGNTGKKGNKPKK